MTSRLDEIRERLKNDYVLWSDDARRSAKGDILWLLSEINKRDEVVRAAVSLRRCHRKLMEATHPLERNIAKAEKVVAVGTLIGLAAPFDDNDATLRVSTLDTLEEG